MSDMFDETLRELERLGQTTVGVPIAPDEKGYVDKECPNSECLFVFKVSDEDWRQLFKDEAVFCPRCRHEASAESWFTTEQIEHAKEVAVQEVERRLGDALKRDARSLNASSSSRGFVRMSMSYSGPSGAGVMIPAAAHEVLEQELKCEECGARFAVLGCAFFCPCCGHNSVERTFDDSLRRIVSNVDALDTVRRAMNDAGLRDEAETTCMSLVESSLGDCVAAFQVLCDGLYSKLPSAPSPPKNAFQRLGGGSDLWKGALGIGYEDMTAQDELRRLGVSFQRRHLLAHRAGLVDEEYLRKSGDDAYRLGQRVVISPAEVRETAATLRKVADALRATLVERAPAS